MDERKLDCCVVRDLLPSYLEDLTEAIISPPVRNGGISSNSSFFP